MSSAPVGFNKMFLAPLLEKFGYEGAPAHCPWYTDFAARAKEKGVAPLGKRGQVLKQIAEIMEEDAERTWFREAVEFFKKCDGEPLEGIVSAGTPMPEQREPEPTEPIPVSKPPAEPEPTAPEPAAPEKPAEPEPVATASSDEGADLSTGPRRSGKGPTVNLQPVIERLERKAKEAQEREAKKCEETRADPDALATAAPDPDERASTPVDDDEFEDDDDPYGIEHDDDDGGF
jgi:hypothetical protein